MEQEINKIKDERDGERQEKEEKEAILEALSVQIEDKDRQIDIKTEEIRILLEKMESYRKSKDEEASKLKDQLGKA